MKLENILFHYNFADSLPAAISWVEPTPVARPQLVAWADDLGQAFSLQKPTEQTIALLAGNSLTPSMRPYAVKYGGHQFGRWAGQLGDGRAITLGELTDLQGHPWELQLKGSGKTPYSRSADGRAVLRSSLREFITSEAMHYLRVPTTRSLSLVTTGDLVERDMFYDGHPKKEPGAIASRLAPTFVRFGNFEIHAAQSEIDQLKRLANWTINNHFKSIDVNAPDAYAQWFREVCTRTAKLVVEWLRVGFVHGVMNTDNMSILGLTIDYGPFGFLDSYEPDWTPNTTDLPGRRYCFGRQASVALWNCERLADALQPLVANTETLADGLKAFVQTYESEFLKMMAGKLGLKNLKNDGEDLQLLVDMDQLLQNHHIDMTIFFRNLSRPGDVYQNIQGSFYQTPDTDGEKKIKTWLKQLETRVARDAVLAQVRQHSMNHQNPWLVPRNYLLFEVIAEVENGNLQALEDFFTALKTPYQELSQWARFADKRPEWAKSQPGSSTLSCSS